MMTYKEQIIQTLGCSVNGYRPSVDQIASAFNMSGRTLSRKVQRENTTVKKIMDEHLLTLSLPYILEGRTIEEVAPMIGYETPGSYIKAFRRWKGLTPNEFKMKSLK